MNQRQENWQPTSWRVTPPMCGCNPQPCEHDGTGRSQRTFEAFRQHNPDLQYSSRPACPQEMLDPQHECSPDLGCFRFCPRILDHHETARFPDGRTLIVSQPYGDRTPSWHNQPEGLQIRTSGPNKSWCNPGMTRLLLIGTPETVARINLDYEAHNI